MVKCREATADYPCIIGKVAHKRPIIPRLILLDVVDKSIVTECSGDAHMIRKAILQFGKKRRKARNYSFAITRRYRIILPVFIEKPNGCGGSNGAYQVAGMGEADVK